MTDLSSLSDDQLKAMYGAPTAAPAAAPDLSKMSDEQLKALHGSLPPSVGVAEDVAKSGGVGLAKGAIGLAGMGGDLAELAKKGADWVGSKLPDIPSPSPDSTIGKTLQFLRDESAKSANLPAAQGSGDLPGSYVPPTSSQLQKSVEGVTGDFYTPKTIPGQYAQTVGEFAPAALGGGEGLLARVAKQVVAPAVTSETAGQLTQGTAAEPYARVAGAVTGGGLASVLSKAPEMAAPTVEELKNAARAGYNHPDVAAVQIKPQAVMDLGDKIRSDLESKGYRDFREKNTFNGVDELSNPTPTSARAAGGPATVADLDSIRKGLGNTAKERDAVGSLTPDANAANHAIGHIDDFLTNLKQPQLLAGDASKAVPVLQDARWDWAAAKRAQAVQTGLDNARIQAASTYGGGNINNAMRQKLRPLAMNDFRKAGGFNDAEKGQLSKGIEGSWLGNTLRQVGKYGPDTGLKGLEHIGAAYATGGASVPLSLAAFAAKKIGDSASKRNFNKLDEMLRTRSPLHEANLQNPAVNPALTAPLRPPVGRSALVNAMLATAAPRTRITVHPGDQFATPNQ